MHPPLALISIVLIPRRTRAERQVKWHRVVVEGLERRLHNARCYIEVVRYSSPSLSEARRVFYENLGRDEGVYVRSMSFPSYNHDLRSAIGLL